MGTALADALFPASVAEQPLDKPKNNKGNGTKTKFN